MALGRTARFYRKNRASREKKKAYDTKYHSTPARRKYRSKLAVIRRRRGLKGNKKDLSHTVSGGLVLESKDKNRGRQGANGKSTKKSC